MRKEDSELLVEQNVNVITFDNGTCGEWTEER
jgi:hypothetical protein